MINMTLGIDNPLKDPRERFFIVAAGLRMPSVREYLAMNVREVMDELKNARSAAKRYSKRDGVTYFVYEVLDSGRREIVFEYNYHK
jgi:hypothetical protein